MGSENKCREYVDKVMAKKSIKKRVLNVIIRKKKENV